jgi:hypothetical protein
MDSMEAAMTGMDNNHGTLAKIISIQMLLAWAMVTMATLTRISVQVTTVTKTSSMIIVEAIMVSGEEAVDVDIIQVMAVDITTIITTKAARGLMAIPTASRNPSTPHQVQEMLMNLDGRYGQINPRTSSQWARVGKILLLRRKAMEHQRPKIR